MGSKYPGFGYGYAKSNNTHMAPIIQLQTPLRAYPTVIIKGTTIASSGTETKGLSDSNTAIPDQLTSNNISLNVTFSESLTRGILYYFAGYNDMTSDLLLDSELYS